MTDASSAAIASGAALITGYRAPGGVVENGVGTLLRTNLQGGRARLRTIAGTTQLLDISFRSPQTGFLVAATGRGDGIWRTSSGGDRWVKLGRTGRPLTLERFVAGGAIYAVGGSGLVRVP